MSYQSHSGEKAVSNSQRKLERIAFPADLKGKAVLDIGCNEGFFCAEAVRRGASRVVGLDSSKEFLAFAKKKYKSMPIEFVLGSWDVLPGGDYDVVLWLSAMHYEVDPAFVLRNIAGRLKPGGLLILECGVYDTNSVQMVPVLRPKDMSWYPTLGYIYPLLSDFGARQIGPPEATPGDPVPRIVYHCHKRLPTVLLVRGKSGIGKSSLTRLLASSATKLLLVDSWLEILSRGNEAPSPLVRHLAANFVKEDIESVCKHIDTCGLTDEFAELLSKAAAKSDELVIIDGYITDLQSARLAALLQPASRLFVVDRVVFPTRLAANLQSLDFDPTLLTALHELDTGCSAEQVSDEHLEVAIVAQRAEHAETANRALLKEVADLKGALVAETMRADAAEVLGRTKWDDDRAKVAVYVSGVEDRASRAETYAQSLVQETAKLKQALEDERKSRAAEREETLRYSTALRARLDVVEQRIAQLLDERGADGKRHEDECALLRQASKNAVTQLSREYEVERGQWEQRHADMQSHAKALSERAEHAESYNQQLLDERTRVLESIEIDRAASSKQLEEARAYVATLTERAARSEKYGQSLLVEIENARIALEQERLDHSSVLEQCRSESHRLLEELAVLQHYRQLPWWKKLRN